jgi:hypothetical protein
MRVSANVRLAALRLAHTDQADYVPNAAILAGTISLIVVVPNAAHSRGSIRRTVVAQCVVAMVRGRRCSERETKRRLAIALKTTIRTMQGNVSKLERTGASPLLIATRKKRLAKMQAELARLSGGS